MFEFKKSETKKNFHNRLARNKNHKLNWCSTGSYPNTRPLAWFIVFIFLVKHFPGTNTNAPIYDRVCLSEREIPRLHVVFALSMWWCWWRGKSENVRS
jgi:hypothetical protein